MKSNLRFALAVNKEHALESRHFGDADKYLLYDYREGKIHFHRELMNPVQELQDPVSHGSPEKARLLTSLFRDEEVDVLVSKKFGGNLHRINQYFIPVIISLDSPEGVLEILQKHIHWLTEERRRHAGSFQLFQINQGILKSSVRQEKPVHRKMFFDETERI
jgi:predicted Fe-Mo cluster-binding NifX family protein